LSLKRRHNKPEYATPRQRNASYTLQSALAAYFLEAENRNLD
jgi:hypothetical protein